MKIDPVEVLKALHELPEPERSETHTTTVYATLYNAASKYHDHSQEMKRKSNFINEAVASILEGRPPTFDLARSAIEFERAAEGKRNAEALFRAICAFLKVEVEE